ncbi:hypothetical protein R6Q59_004230 [Mikania micrantha]|uniref:RWP-RK domain-containing protein n=1 Tax=Mikania micrantha TaxID=192012 RepID=A0A5N6MNX6_9ASTR|nr:hypothetical protein E3N88_30923 [Mikania micrantha]
MGNPDPNLLVNYYHPEDPENPYKLDVFFYKDDLRGRNDVCNYQRICYALSTMLFLDQMVFAQFWASIDFKSAHVTVLSTRGQPFGLSTYTNELWSYRIKCLDHNSYVNHDTKLCIGLPGRVFLNKYPEWTQDVSKYNDISYPQLNDAKRSNIRGSLAMPVFDGDACIGVLEFVMTNLKEDFSHEMSKVRKALEEVGLKSVILNENINCDISKDYSSLVESPNTTKSSRKSKSCNVTCNDITKLFGMPKADAAKICGLTDNTLTKVQRRYGIDVWPCVRNGVAKSSAHNALERERAYHTSSDETRKIERINCLLMHDNDINFEEDLVDKHMDYLISNDGKRLGEQHDEGPNPVLLEVYHHKNKRSRI